MKTHLFIFPFKAQPFNQGIYKKNRLKTNICAHALKPVKLTKIGKIFHGVLQFYYSLTFLKPPRRCTFLSFRILKWPRMFVVYERNKSIKVFTALYLPLFRFYDGSLTTSSEEGFHEMIVSNNFKYLYKTRYTLQLKIISVIMIGII